MLFMFGSDNILRLIRSKHLVQLTPINRAIYDSDEKQFSTFGRHVARGELGYNRTNNNI